MKPGHVFLGTPVPVPLRDAMRAISRDNRRSMAATIIMALEAFVKAEGKK